MCCKLKGVCFYWYIFIPINYTTTEKYWKQRFWTFIEKYYTILIAMHVLQIKGCVFLLIYIFISLKYTTTEKYWKQRFWTFIEKYYTILIAMHVLQIKGCLFLLIYIYTNKLYNYRKILKTKILDFYWKILYYSNSNACVTN
jgi:hypothetical protein